MTTVMPGSHHALALHDHATTHIDKSNLPAEKKTEIRRFYNRVMSGLQLPEEKKSILAETGRSFGSLVRTDVEAGATGLAVAALEHLAGDMRVAGLKVADGVAPAMAAAGAAWALAAPALGVPQLAEEGANVSGAALAITTYKMGKAHYNKTSGKAAITGEDPELDALANDL
jgi:hypothetical protein